MSDKHLKTLDDIVFENRNREYGAYDLRTSERSNLTKSFLIGLLIIFLLVGGIVGYNYAINRSDDTERVVEIELTDVEIPDIPEEIIEDIPPPPPPPEVVEVAEIRVVMPEPAPNPPKQETIPPQEDMKDKNLGDKDKDGDKATSIQAPPTPPPGPPGDGNKPVPNRNFSPREVSEMAIYPGCEKFKGDKEKLQSCLAQKLSDALTDQLADFGDVLNNRGETKVTAKLQFVIDKSGKIIQVKPMSGGNADLGREAKSALERIATRLSSSGKTIQPAKLSDGTSVGMNFSLPVTFIAQ